jgi:thiamine biosynthesis protein ThiS
MLQVGDVEIRLNGKARDVADGISIRRLLDELGLHPLRVAVQLNDEIIKRDRYAEVILKSGDMVEVLTIMAGG